MSIHQKLKNKTKRRWAVVQKNFHYCEDDVFKTKREAEQYKRDCFESDNKARIIKVF